MKRPKDTGSGPSLAYLLHLWPEAGDKPDVWRVSLQDLTTRSRRGFASLEELFAFLQTLATQNSAPSNETGQQRSE
ncbi:MAG: hypothetical protein R3300_20460 [Candidatus Promineifilaceae bacterium]|nr:hypothetical protein [Candidatus Promineifilaceae bacterium]